ncbi:polyprenyl synthetase family protein [Putridiphycobacter roseus]|uniref:Polyprenyl synthetase family protein n=1 Tax=Putridiphycobacter roseus TaxID=2219161 RepID=A0A2W1NT83_9FLAO|nr:polyprenyl synthetase family protein [Putridiphycobacter roseus]PZE18862.1 polyprenyl synthetase family protein [Putridiphycobacter roseus]
MVSVNEIKESVSDEMKVFEKKFKEAMVSEAPLLNKITHYIIKRKGKQMRPMFVFLTAKMLHGQVEEKTYRAASLIELLHTATLVHDDVVDDANERRGFFSVNALWKNKIAVLVGDYLLSQGLLMSVESKEFQLLKIVSEAVKEMSEGELLQIEKSRKLDITEEVYFEVIRKKTASLIASCCAAGAASVTEDETTVATLKKFGELVGLAFQIKDDIFDYGDSEAIGKPTGNDIREQKMTLPLIYVLNNGTIEDKRTLINIVKNHNENKVKVKEAMNIVIKSGGIQYAHAKMLEYRKEAIQLLQQFPDNEPKRILIGLVDYTVNREK